MEPYKGANNMLESLYMQGLRTPSAEQIQQITNRLKAFGHIEGIKARIPCFIQPPPHVDLELYQQYSKIPLHGGFERRLIPENNDRNKHPACQKYNRFMHPRSINQELKYQSCAKDNTQETLDLFPIHPTGVLQAKNGISTNAENSTPSTLSSSENDCISGNQGGNCGQNFFAFFCGNDTYESH
ncbi:unnamed protein product [Fraxinus pennsylvanica]|uniref:Uncharacterized protein n=1 Tax=Fraxinus pennsylvanica TaxID=56036 RepID=A0AAD1YYH8_9LAMI|nr:unnamed protein product [Fraxinus pennsylvanica]